jgi:hypothetical protein
MVTRKPTCSDEIIPFMCIALPNIDHVALQEWSEVSPERRVAHNNQDREITSSRSVDGFKLDWLVLSSALHECPLSIFRRAKQ